MRQGKAGEDSPQCSFLEKRSYPQMVARKTASKEARQQKTHELGLHWGGNRWPSSVQGVKKKSKEISRERKKTGGNSITEI